MLRLLCGAPLALLLSLSLSLPRPARADDLAQGNAGRSRPRTTSLTLSPVGLLGFARVNVGSNLLGFEQRFGDHVGLLVEGSQIHFHGPPRHLNLYGGALGARWHFGTPAESPFVGLNVGLQGGGGRVDHDHDHDHAEPGAPPPSRLSALRLSVVPHVGYRRIWDSGMTVAIRFGAGYGQYWLMGEGSTASASETDMREMVGKVPIAVDSELSVGYSF